MLRVLQSINAKNADAMYVAGEAMVKGMGVVKSSDNEVILPNTATATDIFLVTKEMIPTGVNTLYGELSDYSDCFENIAADEPVALITPFKGERYFTNQADTVAVGDYLVAGTDGKFEKAASTTSNLKVTSVTYKDAGTHSGIVFEVTDWATIA
jgi:6-phosphogluconate dehydrogenase (decarboxylating)